MYFTYITRLLYFYYIIYGMIFTINTMKNSNNQIYLSICRKYILDIFSHLMQIFNNKLDLHIKTTHFHYISVFSLYK